MSSNPPGVEPIPFDVIVIGAGMGGIYSVKKFRDQGLSVLGIEGAEDVGGVWFHNRYPGARVDIESIAYAYFFDPDLYKEWHWTERYAAQPDILAYLQHVADRYDLRRHIQLATWVTSAKWDAATHRYLVTTDRGDQYSTRFLVMATGQLSKARKPNFPGLDDFTGRWVQTSHWPSDPVELEGKRVAIIGTGSSGVQATSEIAKIASQLTVFQRTANYVIPAQNGPMDQEQHANIASDVKSYWDYLQGEAGGSYFPADAGLAANYGPEEQRRILDEHWAFGGHAFNRVFSDQGVNMETNTLVAEYVRNKIREIVKDPETANTLLPNTYPIGSKRIGVGTDYYETFNRDNVTLIDINKDPIERITATGVKTSTQELEFDVIVFALGFTAFTGSLDQANIQNENGKHLTEAWDRGASTYLGLMTGGFPNLFLLTGPGSPSVLANMIVANVQHVDYAADIIAFMDEHGYDTVQPTREAIDSWLAHVAEISEPLLRRQVDNYMVHVNKDDGSRIFQPYPAGYNAYVKRTTEIQQAGYPGFDFGSSEIGSRSNDGAVAIAGVAK
ncbi:MAG: cyclohexanone monooxygenase [Microbacteriaceae bacterium]|nr:cyclohexanone monooxygenase [Microbacteriaceae bacterium]